MYLFLQIEYSESQSQSIDTCFYKDLLLLFLSRMIAWFYIIHGYNLCYNLFIYYLIRVQYSLW